MLVDKAGIGAGQSSHSHGYMHRGHIYAGPSTELVSALNRGADWWGGELAALNIKPEFSTSISMFMNPHAAVYAAKAWRQAGLEFEDGVVDPQLRGDASTSFSVKEETYDFTPWLRHMSIHGLDGIRTFEGRVLGLVRSGASIVGARVMADGVATLIKAQHVVLAAGTGNLPLASSVTRYRGRALNRLSFMLVLRSRHLSPISIVSPDPETYGLFVVGRSREGDGVWLVSNFLGYSDHEPTVRKASDWTRATLRTLERVSNILEYDDLRAGVYAAPKGELRTRRGQLDVHSIESYGLENLTVAAPSKLTLAPLLAGDVARRVAAMTDGDRRVGPTTDGGDGADRMTVANEQWTTVPLVSYGEFARVLRSDSLPSGSMQFNRQERSL